MGKTLWSYKNDHRLRKHPHGRGEDHYQTNLDHRKSETPPRAWGRLTIPELNFIRDVFNGWPVILDRITLTRSNKDVDFFYTVNIKARLIGGK